MELILHLGAHRTGTTALQMACRKNKVLLGENGIAFWGPDMLRDKAMSGFANRWLRASSPQTDPELTQTIEMMQGSISQQAAENSRILVISEENLIGTMVANFKNQALYGRARERLIAYAGLFPNPPAQIFLCVRDYASYWASSYVFAAMRNDLPPIDEILPTLIKSERGWCDVIDDISAVFPESKLTVRQHETQSESSRQTLVDMFGATVKKMKIPAGPANASASAAALVLAQQMRQANPNIEFKEIRDVVAPLNTPDAPIFQPFSSGQVADLASRYQRDIATLRGRVGKNLAFSATSAVQAGLNA